jgi:hypothetical protein
VCLPHGAQGNLLFTVRMGERVPFGLWLLSAVLHMGAAVCASEVRDPLLKHSRGGSPLEVVGNDSGEELLWESAEAMAEAEETAEETVEAAEEARGGASERARAFGNRAAAAGAAMGTRCVLCGATVVGYDHHCIWLDACIGAHNLGAFVRGLLCFAGATGVQAALCAQLAWDAQRWGLEAVSAAYAALVCLSCLALLASIGVNLARGLTGHEARRLRRQAKPLPPARCAQLVRRARPLLCP